MCGASIASAHSSIDIPPGSAGCGIPLRVTRDKLYIATLLIPQGGMFDPCIDDEASHLSLRRVP